MRSFFTKTLAWHRLSTTAAAQFGKFMCIYELQIKDGRESADKQLDLQIDSYKLVIT